MKNSNNNRIMNSSKQKTKKELLPLNEVYQQNTNETIALDQNANGAVVFYRPHMSLEAHRGTARSIMNIYKTLKTFEINPRDLKYGTLTSLRKINFHPQR